MARATLRGMDKPVSADKKPVVIELAPGVFWWCACGRSKKQPYCDSSHKGTGLAPVEFKLDVAKRVALCLCKHTATPPYCDGSHKKLAQAGLA